ncbi:hypothetical protein [Evansella clarkii]|jgi:DnaJ-class molecular chaperone|uniref:hypothetical protein n=1 Tax=Evansella clarkii TaxID=79879 RepID=UPI000998C7AB|nr:hypothetical protein [Evansella clarkii]
MWLLDMLFGWNENERQKNYEENIVKMEEKGKCPDCFGYGYNMFANDYFYVASHGECQGCGGTGTFEAWSSRE